MKNVLFTSKLLFFSFILLMSCNQDDVDPNGTDTPEVTPNVQSICQAAPLTSCSLMNKKNTFPDVEINFITKYNADKKIIEEGFKHGSEAYAKEYTYEYDQTGKITQINTFAWNGGADNPLSEIAKVNYETDRMLVTVTSASGVNLYQGVWYFTNCKLTKVEINYPSQKLISTYTYKDGQAEVTRDLLNSSGVITEKTTRTYELDNKPNPLYSNQLALLIYKGNFTQNNVTKSTRKFYSGGKLESTYVEEYTYTYDTNGLPKQAEFKSYNNGEFDYGCTSNYEYSCK